MTEAPIEVFADVLCPFAHAAIHLVLDRRPEAEADRHRLHVRAWPLEVINGAPTDPGMVAHEVERLRETIVPDLFAGFDRATVRTSSLPALALTAAAYRDGLTVGEAVGLELRHRLWERGEDISDPSVLAEVGGEHGVLVTDDDRASIDADLSEGGVRRVQGSPHFFAGELSVFCPPFTVSTDHGDTIHITPEPERLDEFVTAAFG